MPSPSFPLPRRSVPAPWVLLLALLVPSLLPGAAPAAAETGFSLGPRASTAGFGAELALGLGEAVGLRFGVGTGAVGFEVDSDDVTYDGDVDLRNVLALLDFHPARGNFRISLGALLNDNRFQGEASIRELLASEGIVLPAGFDLGRVRARAEVDPVAPYVGIGWGPHPGSFRVGGWHGSVDVGVAWHGEPEVTLEVLTPIPIGLIPGGQPLVDQILEEERRALQEEVRAYTFFPVIALSLGYRF